MGIVFHKKSPKEKLLNWTQSGVGVRDEIKRKGYEDEDDLRYSACESVDCG